MRNGTVLYDTVKQYRLWLVDEQLALMGNSRAIQQLRH